jgi:hypothetical protein
MNHTNVAIVAMLAATAAALIGAIGVNIGIQTAAAQNNVTDIENSETNFKFKQKLKNNCSGFATCANTGLETFTATLPGGGGPVPGP